MSVATVTKAEVAEFSRRLRKWYGLFTLGFLGFVIVMFFIEQTFNPPRVWIGYAFLLLTLGMYAVIGILNFTRKLDEYYVAGRKVPPFFNGMATGADWMRRASFISRAGTIGCSATRSCVRHGLDRWLRAFLPALRSYIRKVRPVHDPDFVATRFAERAEGGSGSKRSVRDRRVVHLRHRHR